MPLRPLASTLLVLVMLGSQAACTPMPDTSCAGETVRLVRPKILVVGTDFAYPPFAFDDPETGEPNGFDVDLAGAVAEQLGLKLLLVNRTSAALIPGLLADRHDLAASAILASSRLREEVCVSSGYLDADLGLMARPGDPPSIAGVGDLENRSVGVIEGSRSDGWIREHGSAHTKVVRAKASEDLQTALRARQIDGVIDDLPVLQYVATQHDDVVVVDEIDTGASYVLAAAPDNLGLLTLVNNALEQLRMNAKLDELHKRWFGS